MTMSEKLLLGYLVWDGLAGVTESDLVVCFAEQPQQNTRRVQSRPLPDFGVMSFTVSPPMGSVSEETLSDTPEVDPDTPVRMIRISHDGRVRNLRPTPLRSFVLNGGHLLERPQRFDDFSDVRPLLSQMGKF